MYAPSVEQLDQLHSAFTYHRPHTDQPERYERLRNACGDLAAMMIANAPQSRELSLALTNLEQASMWVNAAIARNEPTPAHADPIT